MKWVGLSAVVCLAACAGAKGGGSEGSSDSVGTQGMALKMDVDETKGITGMHFDVAAVSCTDGTPVAGATPVAADKTLSELRLPGGTPELEDSPLDKKSRHVFADYFVTLAAGCYDVTVTPATKDAVTCHAAKQSKVQVLSGKTTEIFLMTQCDGTDPGALDMIAAANHPPVLLDVSFKDSKFGKTCAEQVVCATAQDPEQDPLEFVLKQDAGPAITRLKVASTTVNADGSTTQCWSFVPQAPGKVDLTVMAYDVLHTAGAFQRIEDWLTAQGYPNPSHASLSLPAYATGDSAAVKEVCDDGIDNDCDGKIDLDDTDDCGGIPDEGCPKEKPTKVCTSTAGIDIMLLQDLSGSFSDDITTLRGLSSDLVNQLNTASPDVLLGDVAFIDKPFSPYGGTGDYTYKALMNLVKPGSDFVNLINGLTVGWGNDESEAQLEALNLVAINATSLGFRAGTYHFAVLATDAPFHQGSECTAAGLCTSANNMDGVPDEREDYPTVDQAIASLNAASITPVFAVAGGGYVTAAYEGLVSKLGRGKVVPLASDSSNIVNAIFAGMGPICHCE